MKLFHPMLTTTSTFSYTSAIENKSILQLSERSKMKKLVLYGGLIVVAILGVMAYNYALNAPVGSSSMPATPTAAPWQPASLHIPSLHIDAAVINVGATSGGVMDAPTSKAI